MYSQRVSNLDRAALSLSESVGRGTGPMPPLPPYPTPPSLGTNIGAAFAGEAAIPY
jgi:hypothetical protein